MSEHGHDRGVTRPHMEHGGDGMSDEDRLRMLREHHGRTAWVYWTILLLGIWTVLAPFTLGYGAADAAPSGGREVWLTLGQRRAAMIWSDIVSGLLLAGLGWRGLRPDRPVALWLAAGIGLWLNLAPVLFWSPSAAGYLNGTVVGTLVIALAVLIPGMPNMIRYMRMGPPRPPGWSYNPSSWPQRAILIALAFAGWLASRHLAAYQLGYSDTIWEPFFGDGSRRVLDSDLSHGWPVSDAALGAFAYTLEFLMGWMGGESRWRTMPWMVTFFGILVIPLGLVHIGLVISQPVTVGAWCTVCLLAAALMLPMIPLQVDEVIAMGQNLVHARREQESVWRAFWKGGPAAESQKDDRTPDIVELPERLGLLTRASLWGMSAPWNLVAVTALGVWLMLAPGILGMDGLAADGHHLLGALVIVVAVVAMGEPVRVARLLGVPLGLAIAATPLLAGGAPAAAAVNAAACGIAIAVLSIRRGPVRERYGGWGRWATR